LLQSITPSLQSNGAVKRANALIFIAIKKWLDDQKRGKWAEELPKMVWSHNTSVSRATNFMSFKLLFGEEPITPKEIKFWSVRTRLKVVYNPREVESKDLLEPKILKAGENLHSYQAETRVQRDKKVKEKTIEVKDLVSLQSPRIESSSKLEPKWVGPYLVTKKTRPESFLLLETVGKMLSHSWNVNNLHHFYI
jgi:hypothetical protein